MRRVMPRGIYPRNQERSHKSDDKSSRRVESVKEHETNGELALFYKIVNNLTEISPDKDWKWAVRTTLDLIEKRNISY
jgi:hypothetical protein